MADLIGNGTALNTTQNYCSSRLPCGLCLITNQPCQFCGGEAELRTNRFMSGVIKYYVRCANRYYCSCVIETKLFHTQEEAIEAWNRRCDDE